MSLESRYVLVTGVRNEQSIAWHTSLGLIRGGAQVVFSCYSEREADHLRKLLAPLAPSSQVFCCDATRPEQVHDLRERMEEAGVNQLHGLVHAMAFARKPDLQGGILGTSKDSFHLCMDTTAFSLLSLCSILRPLLAAAGSASVLTYTFIGSERAVAHYNVVGLAKAALEAEVRYLATELGPQGTRVNAISAGPIPTISSGGIPGFEIVLQEHARRSALRRNVRVDEVANTACFLLSPLSSGITGETIYVDAGFRSAF